MGCVRSWGTLLSPLALEAECSWGTARNPGPRASGESPYRRVRPYGTAWLWKASFLEYKHSLERWQWRRLWDCLEISTTVRAEATAAYLPPQASMSLGTPPLGYWPSYHDVGIALQGQPATLPNKSCVRGSCVHSVPANLHCSPRSRCGRSPIAPGSQQRSALQV